MTRAHPVARFPRLLTPEQVGERLGCSEQVVRTRLRRGELRGFRLGGHGRWRVDEREVEEYLREHRPRENPNPAGS